MDMKKIQKIIEKIRMMAKYNPDICQLVAEQKAEIKMKEDENGNIVLHCIEFSYYDALWVYEDHMTFSPDNGKKKEMFRYNGWDGLLKM